MVSIFLFALADFDASRGFPGEGPLQAGNADDSVGGSRGTRRPLEEPSHDTGPTSNLCISAPRGRHTAICATCCGQIQSRAPRVRRGDQRSRVHHVACVAAQIGSPRTLSGWAELDAQSQAAASAQHDTPTPVAADDGTAGAVAAQATASSDAGGMEVDVANPGHEERVLQRIEFWSRIPWPCLHDPVATFDAVPDAVKGALAELRQSIASAALSKAGLDNEEDYLKAFFFLDRLMFATSRRRRGGARGQHGETIARTLARRIRTAWSGGWAALWEESSAASRRGAGGQLSEAQALARDVKAIREALADEDLREALRCVDGKLSLASDAKARRCLPALFPQAQTQPNIPDGEPLQEDVDRFRRELRNAYRHGPRHRGSGPGGARNEHWSWMPALEDAWAPTEELMLRFALARLPARAMAALMSARVLAGDRSEDDKV